MDARPERRGLTNGLGPGRALPPAPGHVNGIRGATNGLVNGTHGHTNGLVNGTRGPTNGLVNGTRGRTNGLVNGRGAVNGSGFVNGLSLRRNPFGIVTHRDLRRSGALLALSIVAILVLGYFLSVPSEEGAHFTVDGDFGEWKAVPKHADDADAPGAGDLVETAVNQTGDRVFLYARLRDDLFAGPEASSVYALLSVDGRDGYRAAPGFAAAFVAEAYGWDGALRGAVLREWPEGSADADNASALVSRGAFPAAANSSEIELSLDLLDLGLEPSAGAWFRFATRAGIGADVGPIMGRTPGGLLVEQESLVTTVSGSTEAVRLTFSALAVDVTVRDLAFEIPPGSSYTPPSLPFGVAVGTPVVVDITVSPGALSSGALYTARVKSVNAVVAGTETAVRATVSGDGARAHVDVTPAGHAVDGLFGDWAAATPDPNDSIPPPIDIRESAVALQAGAFFYVRTGGDAMAGALLPSRPSRPEPGNASAPSPNPVPFPRIAGEDVLRIYLDTDDRDAAGEPFGGLFADRMIEVRGRLGRITATNLHAWNASAGRWEPRTEVLDLAFVGSQLEAFAPPAFLGTTSNASAVFAMSDWSGAGDLTGVHGLRGTRGLPGVRLRHGAGAETVVAMPLTNIPNVDGNCATTNGEYDGASQDSNANLAFYLGQRSSTQYLYVCVRVTADTTNNGLLDWGELLFDRNHDGQDPPQDGDRRFRIGSGPVALTKEKGSGMGDWISCDADCDVGDIGAGAFTNGEEVYEFRIQFSDVWGTNSPTGNQLAGFAIVAHDAATGLDFSWGSDEVNENTPSTWGQVEIPEFPPVLAATTVVALALLGRRRPKRRRSRAANP